MIKKLLFLLFLFVYSNASTGFTSYEVYSKLREQNIKVMLFYPSFEKENFFLSKHKLFKTENVSLNASIKEGKYPLIVLAHGGLRSAPNQIDWLASSLAKKGFVVLLTRSKLKTKQALYEPWLRANDLYLGFNSLQNSKLVKSIDKQNVFSVGFLLGGTSLMLSNSISFDMNAYINQCKEKQSIDCNFYKKHGLSFDSFDKGFIKNIKTKLPIKKSVLFDVELSKLFDKTSLKTTNSNFTFVNLSSVFLFDNKHLANQVANSKYEKILTSNLFSSFSLCTKKGKMILSGSQDEPDICFEKDTPREEIHKKILNTILKQIEK